jgi:hypothetical protein
MSLPTPKAYEEFVHNGRTWQPLSLWVGKSSINTYPNVWQNGLYHLTLLHEYEFRYGGENGKHWRLDSNVGSAGVRPPIGRTKSYGPITLEAALSIVDGETE